MLDEQSQNGKSHVSEQNRQVQRKRYLAEHTEKETSRIYAIQP